MNHRQMVRRLAKEMGFLQQDSVMLLRKFIKELRDQLLDEGKAYFPGIGTIQVKVMPPRRAFNPRTLQEIRVGAMPKLTIRPTKEFKAAMRAQFCDASDDGDRR